ADPAPRRHGARAARRGDGSRRRRRHRPAPRGRHGGRQGQRRASRPAAAARRRGPAAGAARRRRRGAAGAPPLDRPRARRGGATPVPRRQGGLRTTHRQRLLLRLRVPGAHHRRRSRAARGGDAPHPRRRGVGLRAQRGPAGRGAGAFRGGGRGLQGRGHRPAPRGRADLVLPPGRLRRPVPGPASADVEADQGLPAAVARGRVLARRLVAPAADTGLRHRVLEAGRPRGAPAPDRGGEAPGPSAARTRARAVHVLGRGGGHRLLAAERHPHLQPARRPVAGDVRRPRLHRGQDAAALRRRAVEDLRALVQVPGPHVRHRGRGAADGTQADELPRPRPALQAAAVVVPRPAPALQRARPPAPERALRGAARPASRAPLRAGRRTHLLHARAGARRGEGLPRHGLRDVRAVRHRDDRRALDAPSRAHGRRRAVGRGGGAARPSPGRQGPRVRRERGRRRLLRTEDRSAHDGLARSLVAARHGADGLPAPRALRPHLHGRRQRRAPRRDAPPRAVRLVRALHRHPARGHRWRSAALAGARPGARPADRGPARVLRRGGRRPAPDGGPAGPCGPARRVGGKEDRGGRVLQGARHARRRRPRAGDGPGVRAPPRPPRPRRARPGGAHPGSAGRGGGAARPGL
ncbi:MAG: Threonyl-tRNA synthetase, partial [uncultured Thermoleophilia bacterium]